MKTYKDIFIWASGFYLIEHLPDNYETYDEDMEVWVNSHEGDDEWEWNEDEKPYTLAEWIKSRAWEPFEHWDADDILAEIDSLTSSAESFFKEKT